MVFFDDSQYICMTSCICNGEGCISYLEDKNKAKRSLRAGI